MKDWMKIPLGILLGLAIAAIIQIVTSPPRGTPIRLIPAPTASLIVQVSGAVQNAGVYSLPAGSRVSDAISAAGGFLPEAQSGMVNLARPLKDGENLIVLSSTAGSESSGALSPALLNINSATAKELESLPAIGATRAQAILQYRLEHGNFVTIEELQQVPGIGRDVYDQIKDLITVD